MAITQIDATQKCIDLAVRVGIEEDQLRRFLAAGYVPQAKGMEFHALARQADNPDNPYRIGYGGTRGQAKSHTIMGQVFLDDMQRVAGLKGLYLRLVQKRARESFEDLRRKVLAYTPHHPTQGKIEFPNGSFMIVAGIRSEREIDDYLGLEYDVIVIEDATLLSKAKYDAIRGSFRTSKDWRPRLYAPANPGGVGHRWYVDEFIKNQSGQTAFVHTKLGDNVHINPEYVDYLNSLTGFLRKTWRDGDFSVSAGQFFTTFSEDIHVIKPFAIPSDWELIGALDHGNQHPTAVYNLARSNDDVVYFTSEHVANRTPITVHAKSIKQMLADIPGGPFQLSYLRSFVAGGDVFAETRKDKGTVAKDYLAEGINLRMANTARVQGAQELQKRLGDPRFNIDPSLYIFDTCPRLIECISNMQHDPRRQEDVLKVDADVNGDGGDDCFVAGTLITTLYGDMPIEIIRPGDMILTRVGYRPVRDIWISGNGFIRPTVKVNLSSGKQLIGTPNHKVFNPQKGWIALDTLRYGDTILSSNESSYYRRSQWQNQKQLSLMGLNSAGIQTLKTKLIAGIIGLAAIIESAEWDHFIKKFGGQFTEKFQKDIISTILMETHSIMIPQTLKLSMAQNISLCTQETQSILRDNVSIWTRSDRFQPLGIGPHKERFGTASMPNEASTSVINLLGIFASNAIKNLLHPIKVECASVPTNANRSGEESAVLTMLKKCVRDATKNFMLTSTEGRNIAPVSVLGLQDGGSHKTYAIHVSDQHEYYANDVLVSNCYDAARYGLMEFAKPRGWVRGR